MGESVGAEVIGGQALTKRQKLVDVLWKAAASLVVAFLIHSMLHLMSRLVEIQGS